jgi:predicted membrane-bound spermidine synthase
VASRPVSALPFFVLAFLSGTAALTYEVVWAKTFALTFGSSTLAASASVAGFMGGMGLGAHLYPRLVEERVHPLRAYAALEFGIAATAALFSAGFQWLPGLFAAAADWLPGGVSLDVFRVLSAMSLLIVPASLMGATFPALCLVMLRTRSDVDQHLGWIYGWNTLGAAAGALAAGFVFIEVLGLRGSVALACAINLLVGLAALLLFRIREEGRRPAPDSTEGIPTRLPAGTTGLVLFAAGFATLAYEILWFRALRYLVGNSTYALSLIFVIFLLGLGVGGLIYRPLLRRVSAEALLGVSQLGIAVLALGAIFAEIFILGDYALSEQLSVFSPLVQAQPWWKRLLLSSEIALCIMLPATLLMGLAFPLASRLFLGSLERLGRRVGFATLLSNLGSIVGSIGAAVVILPLLGTVTGTTAVAFVNLGLGILILRHSQSPPWWKRAAAAAALVLCAGALFLPTRMPFRGERAAERVATELVFEQEDDLGTVQVRAARRNPENRVMLIDGSMIAASRGFLEPFDRKQTLLAHLPLAIDGSLRRTLNVGLASGSTLEAIAGHPELVTLDTVEINPAVAKGAAFFSESQALGDPRARLFVEDAVHHLLRSPEGYDLVISDGKQNKDYSGNSKVLSWEFFDYARRSLSGCGLFVHWIPGNLDGESFEIVVRTLLDVFPEVEIFVDGAESVLMVGSDCPIGGRRGMSQSSFVASGGAEQLGEFGLGQVETLKALWVAGRPGLEAILEPGPLNDWNHMPLEYRNYRAPGGKQKDARRNLEWLVEAGGAGPTPQWVRRLGPDVEIARIVREALLLRMAGEDSRARGLLREAVADHPDSLLLRRENAKKKSIGAKKKLLRDPS